MRRPAIATPPAAIAPAPTPGLICGVSATNTCGSCTSDSQCKSDSFYGANDICNTTTGKCVTRGLLAEQRRLQRERQRLLLRGSCTTGNCCTDTDCGSSGTACVNHTCSACNAVSGNKWYVDPINGNDSTATGSDMAGDHVAPGCAFKTIKKLLNVMPSTPFAGTQIIIVGTVGTTTGLAAGETYPVTCRANTTLTTSEARSPSRSRRRNPVPAEQHRLGHRRRRQALRWSSTATATQAASAILNSPGASTSTAGVSNLTIRNTSSDGIRVTRGR